MLYKSYLPPVHLRQLVQCFWGLESVQYEALPQEYYLMADSCAEIIFQYNEGFKNYNAQSCRVRFQHSVHKKFIVADKVGFFGVRLYPQAIRQMLNVPANELANEVFDLDTLFKQEGAELAEQVYSARTTSERVNLVSDFITRKTCTYNVDPVNYFVNKLVNSNGWVDIAQLHQDSGLSVKQFERRFKAVAGFPPKYFARIARFQGLKNKYCSNQFKTMTSLAYSGKYYDQAHFNREFKEFSGVAPLKYFRALNQKGAADTPKDQIQNEAEINCFNGYLPCGWFV